MEELDFTSIETVRTVLYTTLDFYELMNRNIDKDKEVTYEFENILDSKTQTKNIGVKIIFKWNTTTKLKWEQDTFPFGSNELKVYSKDRLQSITSDISSILNDIDAVVLH